MEFTLAETTGIDVGYRPCGVLRVTFEEAGRQKLAHEIETVLDRVRSAQLTITPDVIDIILAGADYLRRWLTHLDENPNGAAFLFVADRARSDKMGDYKRCFELFDGRDETAVADTRERWTAYKAAGHTVVYWQQTASGGW